MKRFGILLIVTMFGLVLVCGCGEDKKAPAKPAAPPAKAEKITPPAPPAKAEKITPPAPPATPPPAAPEQPKPDHPKAEHPK